MSLLQSISCLMLSLAGRQMKHYQCRAYRGAVLSEHPRKRWRVIHILINAVFFDRNHCKDSYFSEVYRRQYTDDFQQEAAK